MVSERRRSADLVTAAQQFVQRALGHGLVLAITAVAWFAPTASALPPDAVYSTQYIDSADGTPLFTQVFRPAQLPAGARTPVILIVGPYFGNEAYDPAGYDTLPYYDDLFDAALPAGYTIVQVTLRGFGGSGGCSDWGGPAEQSDVVAAVEWAASRPWSTGKVGMYGLSRDASSEVMALAARPRGLAAAVIASAVTDGYMAFYMNGNRYTPFSQTLEPYYQGYVLPPPDALTNPIAGQVLLDRLSDPVCEVNSVAAQDSAEQSAPYWRARDWVPGASGSTVPVLYSQGFIDANVKPDNFMALWPKLTGPKRAWLGQWPHEIPGENYALTNTPDPVGRMGFLDEAMAWFDRYLNGAAGAASALGSEPPIEVQEGSTGDWRTEPAWPPPDATLYRFGVLSGSYQDQPGNKGEPYCQRLEPQCPPGPTGNGSWTFSQPLPHDIWLSGTAQLSITIHAPAPQVTLVAFLYDISPAGQAALITRGAITTTPDVPLSVPLYPQDWRLSARHRLGILLSGADDGWFTAGTSGAQVSFTGGALRAPFLRYQRTFNLAGGPSQDVQQRQTFTVSQSLIQSRTERQTLPPAMIPARRLRPSCAGSRLRLRVRPHRVVRGRATRFHIRVLLRCDSRLRPVAHALVRLGGAHARTNHNGWTVITHRFQHRGRVRVTAQKRGFRAGARKIVVAYARASRREV